MFKDKTTIHLSHTDLDGIGAVVLSRFFLKNVIVERISYNKITETLLTIKESLSQTFETPQLLITDLKFSEEDFKILYDMRNLFEKIVYIDHHLYEFEIPTSDNLIVRIDHNKCGAKGTYDYFKDELRVRDIEKYERFIHLVDVFDLFKEDHKDFEEACGINRLFWNSRSSVFERTFRENPEITPTQKLKIEEINRKILEYFEKMEKEGKIFSDEKLTLSFCDKHLSEFRQKYESDVYVNLRDGVHFSIKINKKIPEEEAKIIRENILSEIDDKLALNKGGHLRSFGVTYKRTLTSDEIKKEVEKIVSVLSK